MESTKTEAAKTTKTKTTKTTKTETKERKENMENKKKTAPKTEMSAAEKIIAAAEKTPLAARIAKLFDIAKTAAKKEDRAAAAEEAAALVIEFNKKSEAAAAGRCSFLAAAEAVRLPAPKKIEARVPGVDYERRAEVVRYPFMSEDGDITLRTLTLPVYARIAFAGKTATTEQRELFAAALAALERFQKAFIEKDSAEGVKPAAAALTALVKSCGIDILTAKKNENGEAFPFFVHKSFVYSAAARMKCKRGVYVTAAAAVDEAAAAALAANDKAHARAAARLEKAEAAAAKTVFTIINEAAAAAVAGVWNASVLTAEEAKTAREARAAEEARRAAAREKEKEAARAAKAKEKERREAERREALAKREAAAKKTETPAAKKTAKKTAAKKTETPAA